MVSIEVTKDELGLVWPNALLYNSVQNSIGEPPSIGTVVVADLAMLYYRNGHRFGVNVNCTTITRPMSR